VSSTICFVSHSHARGRTTQNNIPYSHVLSSFTKSLPPLCWLSRGGGRPDLVSFLHLGRSYRTSNFDYEIQYPLHSGGRSWPCPRMVRFTSTLLASFCELLSDGHDSREKMPAPPIAIEYWRLKNDATLLDVIYAVRSDETTHRFVNHSLANLNPSTDVNPFAIREPDMHVKGAKLG
jgi:hypothetical protein